MRNNGERLLRTVARGTAPLGAVCLVGYACAGGPADVAVLEAIGDGGTSATAPAINPDAAASCGMQGQPCCDGGCAAVGSFCSPNNRCMSAHPTDVGSPCTSGATCQSGLCTYLQALDAGSGANPPSPTVCSEPCSKATDCLAGWTCQSPSPGPILSGPTGPGTCLCAPVAETCDGKDDNCDGVIDEEPGASAACTQTLRFPATCVGAACKCIETCDGGCVTLTNDPNNCGSCGKTCLPGLQVCSGSECVCSGTLCPVPDGGVGDAGYIVPDGGADGSPAVCVNAESDPNNCGGCGIACAYTCAGAGGCVPTMLGTLPPSASSSGVAGGAIVSNGSEVLILTAANGGVIQECSVNGCNQNLATIVLATNLDNTNNSGNAGLLALGGSRAYWPGQAAVRDVTVTAPTVSVFAQPANGSVYAVATNATRVFWSDTNLGILSCAIGATCASPSTLVPIASLPAPPQVLAADDSYVYWMDASSNVFSSGVAGGPPVPLQVGDAGASFLMAMVASAGRVYYLETVSEQIQLMTAAGGAPSSATVYFVDQPTALAIDGINLYWAGANGLSKCALGASCATPTVIYGTTAVSLAVDAVHLYWIDNGVSNGSGQRVWEYHK